MGHFNRNAQYLHWCTKIHELYLLMKIIFLSTLKVISKVVERHRKPLHRSIGTPFISEDTRSGLTGG